jgi:signal transduction histidine kinase
VLLALGEFRPLWSGGVAFALFMLLVSILPSMRRLQADAERALADSVARLTIALARVRSLAVDQRRQLAHLMHGGLQAEMTAAALSISRAIERGDSKEVVDARIADLVSTLERQVPQATAPVGRQSLNDVIETWRLALDIELNVEGDAEQLLRRDPELASRVIDVVSEGMTNAVRHAAAREVRICVSEAVPGLIAVDVAHRGRLERLGQGQGSAGLDERCESWALQSEGDGIRLSARIGSKARLVV